MSYSIIFFLHDHCLKGRVSPLSDLEKAKMNRTKLSRASTLFLLLALLATTITAAKSYVEPDNWGSPPIFVQDTADTPGRGPGVDPWYDDASIPDKPQYELLYIYVDWDDTYLYVRWDVETTVDKLKKAYYWLIIDAVAPLTNARASATHVLVFGADKFGAITVSIRNPADMSTLWSSTNTADYDVTTESYSPPLTARLAVDARYPWSHITGSGPQDIMVIRAESHDSASWFKEASSTASGSVRLMCTPCCTSPVIDYITIGGNPVPWFNSLAIALLASVVLLAFMVKKKGVLPAKKNLSV